MADSKGRGRRMSHSKAAVCILGSALALSGCTGHTAKQIPQPVVEGLKVAPNSARVDVAVPTFSHPTEVTNPLFPDRPAFFQ